MFLCSYTVNYYKFSCSPRVCVGFSRFSWVSLCSLWVLLPQATDMHLRWSCEVAEPLSAGEAAVGNQSLAPTLSHLVLFPDDPELWDFTLHGAEVLGAAAGSPPSRGLQPGTPNSHQMQTRSKTPQRGPTRPPDNHWPSTSRGQERAHVRPQHQIQHYTRPGELSWRGLNSAPSGWSFTCRCSALQVEPSAPTEKEWAWRNAGWTTDASCCFLPELHNPDYSMSYLFLFACVQFLFKKKVVMFWDVFLIYILVQEIKAKPLDLCLNVFTADYCAKDKHYFYFHMLRLNFTFIGALHTQLYSGFCLE